MRSAPCASITQVDLVAHGQLPYDPACFCTRNFGGALAVVLHLPPDACLPCPRGPLLQAHDCPKGVVADHACDRYHQCGDRVKLPVGPAQVRLLLLPQLQRGPLDSAALPLAQPGAALPLMQHAPGPAKSLLQSVGSLCAAAAIMPLVPPILTKIPEQPQPCCTLQQALLCPPVQPAVFGPRRCRCPHPPGLPRSHRPALLPVGLWGPAASLQERQHGSSHRV